MSPCPSPSHRNPLGNPIQQLATLDLISSPQQLFRIPICPNKFALQENGLGGREPHEEMSRKLG